MADKENDTVPDWRRPALLGYVLIFLSFGVLGGWSAFARLDSAVVAPGTVISGTNRKIVQHFEGGMVAGIFVREGDHVEKDQVLITLDPTQAQANADIVRNQLMGQAAQEARLLAERDGKDEISFSEELIKRRDELTVKEAIADQEQQFTQRRSTLKGQVSILENRIKQYGTEIEGLTQEREATMRQLDFINQELTDLRDLLSRNLVQKSRVLAMEREKSRLEGVIGRSIADRAKAEDGITDAKLQIDQIRKKFAEDVNAGVLDVRQKMADLREKVTVSQDILRRIEVRAPRTGVVQNVKVATVGGTIRAGEPLLEIVPDDDGLIVNCQVSPMDIDALHDGMQAEVRFSSFHAKVLPVIMGRIVSVSHDRLVDEASRQPYFLIRVVVDDTEIPAAIRGRITPGMPSDIVIPTGERTVINYLVRPLMNRATKALREQ